MGTPSAMTHAWTPSGGPPMLGRPGSGLVTLLEETSFCISEASGDIVPGVAQGLFFRDTRFISRPRSWPAGRRAAAGPTARCW